MNAFEAWQVMRFPMSEDKFGHVCTLLPDMTPAEVADFIDGSEGTGWGTEDDNSEHATWLTTADAAEIASWIKSCND